MRFSTLLLVVFSPFSLSEPPPSTPLSALYSTRMITSIIARQQGLVSSGQVTSTLETGLISVALQAWLAQYQSSPSAASLTPLISTYIDTILSTIITQPAFSNASLAATTLPLDRMLVAQALASSSQNNTIPEAAALASLTTSLVIQPRNILGGFWYYVYPQWSYLDGAVSFLPFMAATSWLRADAHLQITLLWQNCQDLASSSPSSSGLLVHGYDASRSAVWANQATGASPFVWGRSLAWYLVGLVNAWENLQQSCTDDDATQQCEALQDTISTQFNTLATNLARYQDSASGAWWQLPTLGGQAGNYLESSSTALFVFALFKAVRLELVNTNTTDFESVALAGYAALLDRFVVEYANGSDAQGAVLGFNGTVTVCSLNSTANYTYYTHQPLLPNAPLGSAAFVLASLEMERLGMT